MSNTPTGAPLTVIQALNEVMKHVGAVEKRDRNDHFRFNFRGIDAVVNAASPAFRKFGIVVVPEVLEHSYDVVPAGKPTGHVIVKVKYTFYGPTGDSISATVIGESMDQGDKAVAKAMSVAFRIALLQSLSLPTDETDPDAQSYERTEVPEGTEARAAAVARVMEALGGDAQAAGAAWTAAGLPGKDASFISTAAVDAAIANAAGGDKAL